MLRAADVRERYEDRQVPARARRRNVSRWARVAREGAGAGRYTHCARACAHAPCEIGKVAVLVAAAHEDDSADELVAVWPLGDVHVLQQLVDELLEVALRDHPRQKLERARPNRDVVVRQALQNQLLVLDDGARVRAHQVDEADEAEVL